MAEIDQPAETPMHQLIAKLQAVADDLNPMDRVLVNGERVSMQGAIYDAIAALRALPASPSAQEVAAANIRDLLQENVRLKHELIDARENYKAALAAPVDPPSPQVSESADICGGCGGPYRFDTSVPSVLWNRVVRPLGGSDYLCATCVVSAFVKAGVSFVAELSGDGFDGTSIEVRIDSQETTAVREIQDENNKLRWRVRELEEAQVRVHPASEGQDA